MEKPRADQWQALAGFSFFVALFGLADTPIGSDGLLLPGGYCLPLLLIGITAFMRPRQGKYIALAFLITAISGALSYILNGQIALICAILLLGSSIALGLTAWIEKILTIFCSTAQASVAVAIGFLAGSLISAPISLFCSGHLLTVLQIFLAVLSWALLSLPRTASTPVPMPTGSPKLFTRTYAEALLCLSSLAFATSALQAAATAGSSSFDLSSQLLTLGGLTGALLWLFYLRSGASDEPKTIFLVLNLIAIAEFSLIIPFGTRYFEIFVFVGGAAFKIAFLLTLTTLISLRKISSPFLLPAMCFLLSAMYFCVGAGSFLGSYAFSNSGFGATGLLAIALPVVVVIALSSILLAFTSPQRSDHLQNSKSRLDARKNPAAENRREAESERSSTSTEQSNAIIKERYDLTNREVEVLEYLRGGRSVPYIAEIMCVSENTVKSHVKNLYRKCDVHNRQELLDIAQQAQAR